MIGWPCCFWAGGRAGCPGRRKHGKANYPPPGQGEKEKEEEAGVP